MSSQRVDASDLRPGDILLGAYQSGVFDPSLGRFQYGLDPFLDHRLELHAIRRGHANGVACWIVDMTYRYNDGRSIAMKGSPFWDHYVFAVVTPRPPIAAPARQAPSATHVTPAHDRFPHTCPRCGERAYIGAGPVEHEVDRGCSP